MINQIYNEDCGSGMKRLPDNFIDCCITSPPYWGLRDYGLAEWYGGDENCKHVRLSKNSNPDSTVNSRVRVSMGVGDAIYKEICLCCGAKRVDCQLGLEATPEEYVGKMAKIFEEVKRVLKPEATLWLNLGDSYANARGRADNKKQTFENAADTAAKYGELHDGGRIDLKGHPYLKDKDLVGIPWRVAFALQQAGWWLRQDIIWHKPNPMPESVLDRCTKSHEYIFLLAKSGKYYFDYESLREIASGYDGRKDTMMKGSRKYKDGVVPGQPAHTSAVRGRERWKFKNLLYDGQPPHGLHIKRGLGDAEPLYPVRNKRSVWTVSTKPFKDAHFATFPETLISDCVVAGCPEGGIVLDPFMGAGTTAVVARKLNRNYIGFEMNPDYVKIAETRLNNELGLFR